jgi:hypothetical protein
MLSDPRKRSDLFAGAPGWKALMNVGTGIRFSDLSPAQRDRALQEQVQYAAVDLFGAKQLSQTWFKPEDIEYVRRFDPIQAMTMEQLGWVMKGISRRFKERGKVAKTAALQQQWTQTMT